MTGNGTVAVVAVLILCTMAGGCGGEYLSEPPDDFYKFVFEVPIPPASVELAQTIDLVHAPRRACTEVYLGRLYGTQEDHTTVLAQYEDRLSEKGYKYVKLPAGEEGVTTFLAGEHSDVSLRKTSSSHPVDQERFGKETLRMAEQSYRTLFATSVTRSYGNCGPNPNWTPGE